MTETELRELIGSLARSQVETDRILQRMALAAEERYLEAEQRQQENDRQLKELGKQIGGLGEKLGGYTEGMAYPSMRKLLAERFGMKFIAPRVLARRNGRSLELDVLAYGDDEQDGDAYLVEVKSRLRREDLVRTREKMRQAVDFIPNLRGKRLYGILAAVDIPQDLAAQVLAKGLYLARIRDDVFELQEPAGFTPRPVQA